MIAVILFFLSVSIGSRAWAAGLISLPGITFSEASSNFRLISATGSGSLDDPFIVIEEVFGEGEVLLSINVYDADFGSRIETMHAVGFALQKVVINQTQKLWHHYALELEFDGVGVVIIMTACHSDKNQKSTARFVRIDFPGSRT